MLGRDANALWANCLKINAVKCRIGHKVAPYDRRLWHVSWSHMAMVAVDKYAATAMSRIRRNTYPSATVQTHHLLTAEVAHLSPMPSPLSSIVGIACWGFSCNRMYNNTRTQSHFDLLRLQRINYVPTNQQCPDTPAQLCAYLTLIYSCIKYILASFGSAFFIFMATLCQNFSYPYW